MPIQGLNFTNFKEHKIHEFNLFLKVLHFISKGSLNITEYRRLSIGRVLQLYTMEFKFDSTFNQIIGFGIKIKNVKKIINKTKN